MIQNIRIWNENQFDGKPVWVTIAHEKDKEQLKDEDEKIYFYVDEDLAENPYEKGDLIQLDEWFAILEVDE